MAARGSLGANGGRYGWRLRCGRSRVSIDRGQRVQGQPLTHSLTYVASSRGSGATRRLANIIMLIDPRVGMVGS